MGNKCEHGLKKSECYVCMSPKKGARMRDVLDYEQKKPEPYLVGYRAGWNDALDELIRQIPIGWSYCDLKSKVDELKEK